MCITFLKYSLELLYKIPTVNVIAAFGKQFSQYKKAVVLCKLDGWLIKVSKIYSRIELMEK